MVIIKYLHPCFSIGTSTQFTQSFDNNRFLFRWEFDDQNDKISFSLRVNTTGWVGFGFSKIAPNNMQDYDVIVGGFKDGQGYLNVSCCYSYEKSFPWTCPPPPLSSGYCNVWVDLSITVVRLWQQLQSSPRQIISNAWAPALDKLLKFAFSDRVLRFFLFLHCY